MAVMIKVIRLAVIVEAISCIGMIFQTEPLGFWDKLCDSLGWSPDAVSEALAGLFFLLNLPAAFLASHLFGNVGFETYNGRLVITNAVGVIVLLVQFSIWTLVFFGLFHLARRIKPLFRRKNS